MKRWFLPESVDCLGLLTHQGDLVVAGIQAFAQWSHGEAGKAVEVVEGDCRADEARKDVLVAIKRSFVTPVSPEDIFELSERLDAIANATKDVVREAELVAMAPDQAMADMADLILSGVRDLVRAFPDLAHDPDRATAAADAAVDRQRDIEEVYGRAMSALLDVTEVREVTGRRELYRRYVRMGDAVEHVAHRVWYAVVKEA
ncbi:MAG: DUF47 family protein [Acidimicrobiales bacterium]